MVSLGHPLVYFLEVSFRLFLWSVFLLLFGASTGHLSQSYFWQIICGFMTWPHPVLANFQLSWLLNKQMLHLAENCLQDLKWSYKRRGVVSAPICAVRVRNGPTSANQGCSTDSQGSCPVHAMSWLCPPTSLCSTFFASAKPIFKTNCASLISCDQSQMMQKVSSVVKG